MPQVLLKTKRIYECVCVCAYMNKNKFDITEIILKERKEHHRRTISPPRGKERKQIQVLKMRRTPKISMNTL